ncbi:hypothetical protein ES703_23329 [subsurface metagenome]
MVQINVSQQLKASIGSTRNYEMSGIVDIDGSNKTVQGVVRLMRTDHGILVKGTLDTESELTCSRCLSLFNYPLTLYIEEEYFPTTDMVSGAPLPLPEEPDCFTIDEHNILDLTEAIRQYALLTVPMKPLCHQDCAGLCPTCGINLNQASCDCPPEPADPRWSELSKLVLTDTKVSVKEQEGTN